MDKSSEPFRNFLRSFSATRLLLKRAHDEGFLIEGLVLYALLVDGFCRICIVLREQIEKGTAEINKKYIYQADCETNFSERTVYKQALKRKVINKELFDELNALYDIRNKMIHRFFISEIEYSHLEIVCKRYERVYNKLWKITYKIESEQIKDGIGMTISGPKITNTDKAEVYRDAIKKIKSGNERNLAKTLGYTSVEEIIEFASKNGLVNRCVCDHEITYHISVKNLKKNKSHNLDDGLTKCSFKGCGCSSYIHNPKKDLVI